jgi:3-phosphoshikimate 1-carboxyvinyltransferase
MGTTPADHPTAAARAPDEVPPLGRPDPARGVTDPVGVAVVPPATRLRGEVLLPGDKSISHRALILAALATGESRIWRASDGADVRSTAEICRALGVMVERLAVVDERVDYRVVSPGASGLREPEMVLDCGNSGTTLRLVAGVLAGLPGYAVLDGDASLRRRPVARIVSPLRAMGAILHARRGDSLPPLTVVGRHPLRAIEHVTPVPSAQVKSAVLLAGLRADGVTTVREAIASRDHTERMLRARGVVVRREERGPEGSPGAIAWSVEGGQRIRPVDQWVPGDISAAAFWLVAAAIHPDAELTLRAVGVNPTRRAVIDLLRAMGAVIDEHPTPGSEGTAGGTPGEPVGEPTADLVARSSALTAIDIGPREAAAAIDELPILALAATQARGTTRIRGAGELRVKESDRLAGIAAGLTALGAHVDVHGDDLSISGPTPLRGGVVESLGDHRLAMTFAIAGLIAREEIVIRQADSVAISDPGFFRQLEGIRT